VAVTAVVVAVDVASTVWAWTSLPNGGKVATFGVTLSLLNNRGAAFGLGGSHPVLVLLAGVAATVAVALWLARSAFRLQRLGLAVALGGGLGNVLVRVAHGAVIDWIHIAPYPATFNLADVAIRGGLLLVLADAVVRTVRNRNTQ